MFCFIQMFGGRNLVFLFFGQAFQENVYVVAFFKKPSLDRARLCLNHPHPRAIEVVLHAGVGEMS